MAFYYIVQSSTTDIRSDEASISYAHKENQPKLMEANSFAHFSFPRCPRIWKRELRGDSYYYWSQNICLNAKKKVGEGGLAECVVVLEGVFPKAAVWVNAFVA